VSRAKLRAVEPSMTEVDAVRLRTIREVADALHVSERGIYRLVERRAVPFYRVHRAIRLDLDEVLAAIRQEITG
jgi:excisionase family DNA binding protein